MTHRATAAAAGWLAGIGCKPVEAEVTVGAGWVADLVGLWEPTMTEAKRHKLLRDLCDDSTLKDSYAQFANVVKRYGDWFTFIIEVKVSKSDFSKDDGRKYSTSHTKPPSLRPPSNFAVLAGPQSIFPKVSGITRNGSWSILELSEDCSRVLGFRGWPRPNPTHPHEDNAICRGIIESLDHRTRYSRLRQFERSLRAKDRDQKKKYEADRLARRIGLLAKAIEKGEPAPWSYEFKSKVNTDLNTIGGFIDSTRGIKRDEHDSDVAV